MDSLHPPFEELLLWHSRELTGDRELFIRSHVSHCAACQAEIAGMEQVFESAAQINAEVARARQLATLAQWRKKQREKTRRFWFAAAGGGLAAAVLVLTTTYLTPTARAETLLLKASAWEHSRRDSRHFVRMRESGGECSMAVDSAIAQASTQGPGSFCAAVSAKLRSVGWTGSPLSAHNFRRWRAGLARKSDTIRELGGTTAITTTTGDSTLRSAALRMDSSDYHVYSSSLTFIDHNGVDILEEESADMPAEAAAPVPALVSEPPLPKIDRPAAPVIDPFDEAEAQARIALHRIGMDTDVLIAVERDRDSINVWGVAADGTKGARSTRHSAVYRMCESRSTPLTRTRQHQYLGKRFRETVRLWHMSI